MDEFVPEKTPANAGPGEYVVGRRFRAYDGKTYYCEWYDRRRGYEMVEVSPERGSTTPIPGGNRTNVSERAIDRTFHRKFED